MTSRPTPSARRMPRNPACASGWLCSRRAGHSLNRGLSLVECAATLAIVGITVVMMLQSDVNTVSKARLARYKLLAAMLANQLIATESMGNLPTAVGEPIYIGPVEVSDGDERFTDSSTSYFPWRGFTYIVEKELEEIAADTDLSLPANEREQTGPLAGATGDAAEAPKTVQVIRIRVTVRYPAIAIDGASSGSEAASDLNSSESGADNEIVIETYVIDHVAREAARQQAGGGGGR